MPIVLPVLFFAIGWLLLRRAPHLTPDEVTAPLARRLSVIIPAHSEALRLALDHREAGQRSRGL